MAPKVCAMPERCHTVCSGLGIAGVGSMAGTRPGRFFKGGKKKKKRRKQKGNAIKAKLVQLLLISENNKEMS